MAAHRWPPAITVDGQRIPWVAGATVQIRKPVLVRGLWMHEAVSIPVPHRVAHYNARRDTTYYTSDETAKIQLCTVGYARFVANAYDCDADSGWGGGAYTLLRLEASYAAPNIININSCSGEHHADVADNVGTNQYSVSCPGNAQYYDTAPGGLLDWEFGYYSPTGSSACNSNGWNWGNLQESGIYWSAAYGIGIYVKYVWPSFGLCDANSGGWGYNWGPSQSFWTILEGHQNDSCYNYHTPSP